jgi:hypothetical protein
VGEQALDERARSLLAAIRTKRKVTEPEAVALPGDVTPEYLLSLVDLGLLAKATKGSGKKKEAAYELTKTAKEALKPTTKPRATGAKRPPAASVDDLRAMEARLLERLDALAARLPQPPAEAPSPPRNGDLRSAIPAAIRDADLAGRFGGMVPIPEVRKVVHSRTGASRTEFDEMLLALEREFLVDLKIANDPRRPDASEGIAVPGRGLVFFAIAR